MCRRASFALLRQRQCGPAYVRFGLYFSPMPGRVFGDDRFVERPGLPLPHGRPSGGVRCPETFTTHFHDDVAEVPPQVGTLRFIRL